MQKQICFWKNTGKQILKAENGKMERQIIHLKKSYMPLKKNGKNSIIEGKIDQYGNKVSMFETVK